MLHAEHGAVHPTPPQTPDWAQSPWLLGKSPNPGSQLGPPLSGGWRLTFLDLQFSLFRLHVSGLQGEAYREEGGRAYSLLSPPPERRPC